MTTANNTIDENTEESITLMDTYSHHGFSEITAIARLALCSLETPRTLSTTDDIAHALYAILEIADTAKSCINHEAEQAGCGYKDKGCLRRWQAEHGEIIKEIEGEKNEQSERQFNQPRPR